MKKLKRIERSQADFYLNQGRDLVWQKKNSEWICYLVE